MSSSEFGWVGSWSTSASAVPLRLPLNLSCLLIGLALTAPAAPAPFYPDRTNLLQVMDEDGQARPVRSAADWARRRGHILANLELVMGPLPERWRSLPLDLQVLEETNLPTVMRRKITYRVEPADRLHAWLFIPKTRSGKLAAVLCLHQTTDLGKDEPAGLGGQADLHYARELAERGFVTLAPDYWTFGDYRGSSYDPYAHGYVSGTMKGIWNHRRSLDLLQALPEVAPDRLGCIGHSLGGHNALWLAAFDARVRVVVSSCGFNSFARYAASPYGGGTLKNYAQSRYLPRLASRYDNDPAKVPFDWPEVLAAVAPRAVFINAPARDENFVLAGVTECVRAAEPVYALLGARTNLVAVHPDAGHAFPRAVRQQAYEFIAQHLR